MEEYERRRRALALFEEVVELPAAERARRLDAACAGDAALRTQVEALLAADATVREPFAGKGADWCEALAGQSIDPDARVGQAIGAWRIVGTLGHGGMGLVYRVRRADGAYEQQAALKLIRGGSDTPLARERFLRERQTLARLQHPNVASLLDGGFTADGEPWFAMEYVAGEPIDRWCDARDLGLRERVVLFLQVLDAVQYAHRNLVVHRDLKPSNLLVTAEGQVKLLDFGIARQLQDGGLTATAERALTLEYSAPEQLGDEPITTATDVYQLGIVLYRLLSGAHPFGIERDTPLARQLQALSGEPETLERRAARIEPALAAARGHAPQSLARALRGGLAAVVHTCLRREPEARYASVAALADDLRAWLDDRPVAGARLARGERARLWLRRHRALVASAAMVMLALLGGTGAALWQAHQAREQARLAERESANARAALQFLSDTLAAAAPERTLDTEVSVRELLDHARAELDRRGAVDPRVRQPVQRMLGDLYHSLGDMKTANGLFEAGFDGVEPGSREEAVELARILGRYAGVLDSMGRGEEGLVLARRAAAWRSTYASDDPEEQLRSKLTLGNGYYGVRDYDTAIRYWEEAIDEGKRMRDPPLQPMYDAYQMLAGILNFKGEYARALATADEAFDLIERRATVEERVPARITLLRHKAETLTNIGDAGAAEPLIREAIALRSQMAGDQGVSMANLQSALGGVLDQLGRSREALEALKSAHELTREASEDPMNEAIGLANLASAYESAGDYAAALQLFEQGFARLDEAGVAVDELSRRKLEGNYARSLVFAGRFAEADARLRRLQERARVLDGEDSVEYAMVSWHRVVLARQMRDPRQGVPLLAQARGIWARLVPEDHAIFSHAMRAQAVFLRAEGDLEAAERVQREALARFEAGEARPVDLAIARAELARLRFQRGDRDGADQLLARALPVLRDAMLPTEVNRAAAEDLARQLQQG